MERFPHANIISLRELTSCLFIGGVTSDVEGRGIFRYFHWIPQWTPNDSLLSLVLGQNRRLRCDEFVS